MISRRADERNRALAICDHICDLTRYTPPGMISRRADERNRALKLTDASVVAPLQYTLLFWAIVFGFFFFGCW